MIGKTISHYKILEKLGEGGMGVVYKAEDTKLKRIVALKFLPHDLTRDPEAKERFIQEAQAASALDHPNICNIHEIDETEDGQMFICMAYYEGVTLRKKIEKEQLETDEIIDIATQIARGLSKAHEQGIVHRDIKPANIIITTDGTAKILDFGLAKLAGQVRLTKMGTTVGTIAYMSPEQARGEEVDERTDIWSLGVVLYEIITGQPPFRGEYEQAVMYSIMNEEPEPFQALDKEIPAELETIVTNCLEKKALDRYQSADLLIADLQQLKDELAPGVIPFRKIIRRTVKRKPLKYLAFPGIILLAAIALITRVIFFGTEAKSRERIPIAVVDFVNGTNEEELDGLSGMLITSLEQSRRLSVMTRSRMLDILEELEQQDVDRIDEKLGRDICRQANVNNMVLASIHKLGELYTLDLKVLDVKKDEYIFTEKLNGRGQETILSMIDSLSLKTRKEFEEETEDILAVNENVAQITTANFEAYHYYFKGEQFFKHYKWQEAEKEYRKAIEIDSTFGLAYYRLANMKAFTWGTEYRAGPYMQKALAFIDRIPEKQRYLVRAQQARYERGFEEALAILKEMEQYYPNDEEMLFKIGTFSYFIATRINDSRRYTVAVEYLEKVLELDPENLQALDYLSSIYAHMNLYKKMLAVAKRYVAASGSVDAYLELKNAYINIRNYEMAMETLEQARELFPNAYVIVKEIADLYITQKKFDKAEAELVTLVEDSQPLDAKQLGYNNLSYFYPYLGKYREALQYRDKLIELAWQRNDTTGVLWHQLVRARQFIWGWDDTTRALKEGEKALKFKNEILKNPFTLTAACFFHVLVGNYTLADSIAHTLGKIPSWRFIPSLVTAFIQTRNQECDKAEPYVEAQIIAGGRSSVSYSNMKNGLLYFLAKGQIEEGALNKAIETLHQIQASEVNFYDYDIRAACYPKSFFLLGKIYEKKGDKQLAIQNYEKFLNLWKDADEDLPDFIDAKARLAKLLGEL